MTLLLAAAPLTHVQAQAIGEGSPLDAGLATPAADVAEQAGYRIGAFRVLPRAGVSIAYDSNVFASPSPERKDESLSIVAAQLHVANEPGNVDVAGDAFLTARRFTEEHDQDTTQYGAAISLEAGQNTANEVAGRILAQRRFESRTDVETPNIPAVSLYDEWQSELSYARTFNRFALRPDVSVRRVDYQQASQRFRDLLTWKGELRGAYDLRNGLSLIGIGYYSEDDYRFASPLVASAHTEGALVGAGLSLPDIADVELTGGYFRRNFVGQPGAISGISMRGKVTLQPTRLTTVSVDIGRDDAPTRVPGAFGKIRTSGSLAVRHAWSRAVQIDLGGRYIEDDFDVIRRTDRTFLAQAGVTLELTRQYVVAAEYDYAARGSPVLAESFVRHVVSVSLLGRF